MLQKGAQFCLWCHQLMLKIVMEANGQICRGRLGEFDVGIEALSHPSVGFLWTCTSLLLLLQCCGSVDNPWIPAGAGISQEMGRFILSGAHSVSA